MDVITDTHLAALSTANIQQYKAVIIGDGPNGFADLSALVQAVSTWRPAVQGNVIVQGSDAAAHRMTDAAVEYIKCVATPCCCVVRGPGGYRGRVPATLAVARATLTRLVPPAQVRGREPAWVDGPVFCHGEHG